MNMIKFTKFTEDDNTGLIYVFTDGSSYPNKTNDPKIKGGYSIVVVQCRNEINNIKEDTSDIRQLLINNSNIYGSNFNNKADYLPTNIRMEGLAILNTIKYILPNSTSNVIIITDSKFWIDMITKFMPNWEVTKKDFTKQKNSDITIELHSLYKQYKSRIKFEHINSHKAITNSYNKSDIIYNIANSIADEYAEKFRHTNIVNGEILEVII